MSPLTTQEPLFGDWEELHGDATAKNSHLYAFARIADPIVDEGKVTFNGDTMHAAMTDPSNVAQFEVETQLESGVSEEVTVGVNINELYSALQNKPRSPGGDALVNLSIGLPHISATIDQEVRGTQWSISERVESLEPKMVRGYSGEIELDWDLQATLPVGMLSSWLVGLDSTHAIAFEIRDGDLYIGQIADDYPFESVATCEVKCDGEGRSLYSRAYLKDMFLALNDAGVEEATMYWDDEQPMKLTFDTERVSGMYQMAPRLKS